MIYLSFPFEAIGNEVERQILMRLFLEYLNILTVKIDEEKTIQNEFKLFQNFPNPFNPITTIEYSIPQSVMLNSFQHLNNSEIPNQVRDDNVKLIVYDILGREVATLVNQKQKPGNYKIEFDARDLASGVYYFQLKTHNFIQTKKMILLK
ncbi:MAG: T9SS type A sorting domain-containing protein [Ignavibacteriae bacterium]|nr:T9SS type A sorting domain-containing protein [Ignavibacteriota bacterium]